MQKMMSQLSSKLPPLEPLVAFEAAARLLSFTMAAKELNLSQAAVSQRIRNLEHSLGTVLFVRKHKSVHLSSAGREFQHTVSTTLRQLASAAADLRAPQGRTRLTVAADQSIASMWLMSRLPGFQQQFPEISIRLIASDDEQDCLDSEIQLAIIHGGGSWRNFDSEKLFDEEVFVVCSPGFLSNSNPQTNTQIACPDDLVDQVLLELEDNQWNWMNWRGWLSASGTDLPTSHRGFQINSYPLVIDAAKNGQGVALGWRYLVDDDLASGALIKLLNNSVRTDFGYYFVWPANQPLSPAACEFRHWAFEQLAEQKSLS